MLFVHYAIVIIFTSFSHVIFRETQEVDVRMLSVNYMWLDAIKVEATKVNCENTAGYAQQMRTNSSGGSLEAVGPTAPTSFDL